jgi:hypothetical protein
VPIATPESVKVAMKTKNNKMRTNTATPKEKNNEG